MITEFKRTYGIVEMNDMVAIINRFPLPGETVLVTSTTAFRAAAFVNAYIVARTTLGEARDAVSRSLKVASDAMMTVEG